MDTLFRFFIFQILYDLTKAGLRSFVARRSPPEVHTVAVDVEPVRNDVTDCLLKVGARNTDPLSLPSGVGDVYGQIQIGRVGPENLWEASAGAGDVDPEVLEHITVEWRD